MPWKFHTQRALFKTTVEFFLAKYIILFWSFVTQQDYSLHIIRRDHVVQAFDFRIIVENEHASAQSRPNGWKADIQDITHSPSSVDWTVESEPSIETA